MSIEHKDVIVIGAGLAGIGAACQLKQKCPQHTLAILEARERSGGTWDLFRYPGIRSDSDMYTYSYGFKPWRDASAIADGDKILRYIRETSAEYGIDQYIRYQHQVVSADWCSHERRWRLTVRQSKTNEVIELSANFILSCTGYFDYENPHRPNFDGESEFAGTVFHAQEWPENFEYDSKRVVVVGSGATAITLVPSMSERASSVVMLQRSPTYIANVPPDDPWAAILRRWLPVTWASKLTRWKTVLRQIYVYRLSRTQPSTLRRYLLAQIRKELGSEFDVDRHFTPSYDPWDQRLCAAPNGDLFDAIRRKKAEVVTDQITRFNESGIELKSGKQLNADLVVLATGLNLKFAGGVLYRIDGAEVEFRDRYVFRGMMFSGIPNMAFTVGYTNSSWTLKSDLTANYVCRLLQMMNRKHYSVVIPRIKGELYDIPLLDFDAGYVLRSRSEFPKQGHRLPWRNYQNYIKDFMSLRLRSIKEKELEFL